MQRINGRLNLNREGKSISELIESGNVNKAFECSTTAYWLKNFNQKQYLFKAYGSTNQMYRNLIIREMALAVSIPMPYHDIAYFGSLDGELIEDYRNQGYYYISGTKILMEYFEFIKNTNSLEFQRLVPKYFKNRYSMDSILLKMNNIETIQLALSYHYRDWDTCEVIVSEIMKDFKRLFCFDFLTMQRDRGHNNWEIEEKLDQTEAHLAPIIDSNRSFYLPSFQVLLKPYANLKNSCEYEMLASVLEDSDYELFYTLYAMFPPIKVEKLCAMIEKEKNFEMEAEEKILIVASYQSHYEKITEILNRNRGVTL